MREHEELLLDAIGIAWTARERGNHPFGALLVDSYGTVLFRAANTVVTGNDATGHAETNLVRMASAGYTAEELERTTLYTSTEPCAMCAGAIFWSGIGAVVYALPEEALYDLTGPDAPMLLLPCRTVFAAGRRSIAVTGPVALPEARAVHEGFW
ncbi:nucleoside deaminase [Jatrophihabitans sp.]|uniref:nucleoside deaminase n=1 Tax=Jatrophihabitans sp. TaxID=1932789 RepID=UPI0030C6E438|nr:tRNA-specific adenosine deaminase [Jatrophihabitans sp.]